MVMPNSVSLIVDPEAGIRTQAYARQLSSEWGLLVDQNVQKGIVLRLTDQQLELCLLDEPKTGAVFVDFASDALTFRRLHGGGRKESIAKAVGIKGDILPRVLDGTAGLGRDAFVLASLGCQVDMIERSPVVAALLSDGLKRASLSEQLADWLPQRMHLFHGVSYDLLSDWQGEQPDVVYLDPMFPHRKKTAAVKKEMRVFQHLLGPDQDADKLLTPALSIAKHRVVVKRPDAAPWLDNREPNMAISSKKHRFDVYLTHF
jgi:16S rRNA (guanine1516-N2)-methyltransferase